MLRAARRGRGHRRGQGEHGRQDGELSRGCAAGGCEHRDLRGGHHGRHRDEHDWGTRLHSPW
eukprot:3955236-Lingulodinium_polyedra.AAC.1